MTLPVSNFQPGAPLVKTFLATNTSLLFAKPHSEKQQIEYGSLNSLCTSHRRPTPVPFLISKWKTTEVINYFGDNTNQSVRLHVSTRSDRLASPGADAESVVPECFVWRVVLRRRLFSLIRCAASGCCCTETGCRPRGWCSAFKRSQQPVRRIGHRHNWLWPRRGFKHPNIQLLGHYVVEASSAHFLKAFRPCSLSTSREWVCLASEQAFCA